MARDRKERDRAGVGPDPERRRRLISMDDLDGFTLAKGEPDIRGWDVRTIGGRALGEVEDLLIDPDLGEVVMIEVELRDGGVHAEVPIRSVQIDRDGRHILMDSGDFDTRHDLRARDRLTADEREETRGAWVGTSRDVRYESDERYGNSHVMHPDDERIRDARDRDAIQRADEQKQRLRSDTDLNDDVVDETVIERRPVVEEVVVRRRQVDE